LRQRIGFPYSNLVTGKKVGRMIKTLWSPKLKELLIRKYAHRKLKSDNTSIIVLATRERGLSEA
ncbi:uncharacterized protein N7477_008982, partial [Penicillium maclennaniae]|uniref:uncharacterized protein n=1 Tax=Penicillium maclennaniae TaxID=1343394 RepID=UPI002542598A